MRGICQICVEGSQLDWDQGRWPPGSGAAGWLLPGLGSPAPVAAVSPLLEHSWRSPPAVAWEDLCVLGPQSGSIHFALTIKLSQ